MGSPLDSLAMRAFVRGWARGSERRAAVASYWLELSAAGDGASEREVAAGCSIPLSSVRRWLREFRRDLVRAKDRESAMGTPLVHWVVPLTRCGE